MSVRKRPYRLSRLLLLAVLLSTVLPNSTGCYADYVFRETFLKSETAYSPSVQGKIIDEEGKPIDGASVVVVWMGSYTKGTEPFLSLLQRENLNKVFKAEELRSNTEGRFMVPSWSKQQGSIEGYAPDWPGFLVVVVIAPGYRPEIYKGKNYIPSNIYSELVNKPHIDSRLTGSLNKKEVDMSTIRLDKVETIEEGMMNVVQVEDYLSTWLPRNDARKNSITNEYLKDLLTKYPDGPQVKETTELLLSRPGDVLAVLAVLHFCKEIQKTNITENERAAAVEWVSALEGY